MTIESNTPSAKATETLAALKRAVQNTLDRKRRLGQYAVVWRDDKPALLDDDVEDRDAFYESLQNEPATKADSLARQGNQQSGVADKKGEYRSDDE